MREYLLAGMLAGEKLSSLVRPFEWWTGFILHVDLGTRVLGSMHLTLYLTTDADHDHTDFAWQCDVCVWQCEYAFIMLTAESFYHCISQQLE